MGETEYKLWLFPIAIGCIFVRTRGIRTRGSRWDIATRCRCCARGWCATTGAWTAPRCTVWRRTIISRRTTVWICGATRFTITRSGGLSLISGGIRRKVWITDAVCTAGAFCRACLIWNCIGTVRKTDWTDEFAFIARHTSTAFRNFVGTVIKCWYWRTVLWKCHLGASTGGWTAGFALTELCAKCRTACK